MFSFKINSKYELSLNLFIWITGVFYAIYNYYRNCDSYFKQYQDYYHDFIPGWTFLSRKKDVSDYEWELIKYLIKKLYFYIFVHIFMSEICCRYNLIKYLKIFQIILPIFIITNEFGTTSLLIIISQPIIFFTLINFTQKPIIIWILNSVILVLNTAMKTLYSNEEFNFITYILIISIFWMNLKCVSYSLDCCYNKTEPDFINLFSYTLYLPVLFCGPFISYRNFAKCYDKSVEFYRRLAVLILDLIRFLFWFGFGELLLHFIYVNATSFHPKWVETLDSWSFYGYGYMMGQIFHIKYVVLYGLTTSLAKFDKVAVPQLPICIGRVHLYSDMWKYFDVGLYNFLVSYIYKPALKCDFTRYMATFLCFFFVYIWHGTETYILVWTCFNYIGVIIEILFIDIYKELNIYLKIDKKLESICIRRLGCIMAAPLLVFSAISNFYFFARTEIGNIFLVRFLTDSWTTTFILLFMLYNCAQISTELRNRRKKQTTDNIVIYLIRDLPDDDPVW